MKKIKLSGGLRKNKLKTKNIKPFFSIIMVVLNNEKFIQKSIDSVINQSFKSYELIIIDGGSTDNTVKILKKNNSKINLWISEKDKSLYDAMNKGIKLAKGSIISILNSDDIFYSNALKIAAKYFQSNKNIDFLFGSVIKHKLLYGYKPWKIHWSFGFYSTHSIGFFIKRNSHLKVGFYNIKYKYSADYDFFYRLILKHKMIGMATNKNEVFGKFRSGGISSYLPFKDYLNETCKIRIDNGQNRFAVKLIYIMKNLMHLIRSF